MRLFAFLSSVALASAYQCPDQKPVVSQPCNNPTLFAFDVSDTISSNDATFINNFIFQNLTPSLANGQMAGVILGGVSGTQYQTSLTSIYPVLCDELNNLYSTFQTDQQKLLQPYSLTNFMQRIASDYDDFMTTPYLEIVLFSASTDTSDILTAANVIKTNMTNVKFTVVSMSGKANLWDGFRASRVIPIYPWDLGANQLTTSCIMQSSCGYTNDKSCLTTTAPPPTADPSQKDPFDCRCNPSTYGADMVLIFDNSLLTGNLRQSMLLQTVQEALADFNIQADINGTSGNESTRIAVITYASTDYSAGYSNRIVQYILGELSLAAFQNLQTIQRKYDSYRTYSTNPSYPDGALYTASSILTSSPRFGKVLPVVIHLTGTDENDGGSAWSRTNTAINAIKNNGGVIFTYQLFGNGDLPTNGYFDQRIAGSKIINASALYAKQRAVDSQFIRRGLCLAVCKCPQGYKAKEVDSTYGTPVGGCLMAQTLANYPAAQSRCAKTNDGIVAPTKTAAESEQCCSMVNNGNFYTGMMWDSQQQKYIWSDGTPVNGDYQPWYNNMTHPTGQDCVMVYGTHNEEWVPTYCKNGFPYVCKTHPCDSATRC